MRGRRHRPRRRVPGVSGFGRLLLVVALLSAGGVYVQLQKTVTLVVDGEPSEIRTFSSSVGQLLSRRGIEVGDHDKVKPGLEAALTEGMRVEVLIAKEVTLVLNGEPRTLYVTGQTVEDVLEHINLRSGKAYVYPSRSSRIEDGDEIVYRPAVSVTVKIGGKSTDIITNEPDVGHLLNSMGVILGARDRVTPDATAELTSGMTIAVIRVKIREVTERKPVPFETEVRYSDELVKGERRVERAGQPGVEELVYRVKTENGKPVARTLVSRRVVEEPVSQIEVVGTREPNVQSGIASWYERSGMTAAHRTLPFGTRVTVTNVATGKSVVVVIDDRGPYIDGRIIDLSDDAFAQLAPLSAGTFNARISW
jgi:resuscitation-promoting factor RpfB